MKDTDYDIDIEGETIYCVSLEDIKIGFKGNLNKIEFKG